MHDLAQVSVAVLLDNFVAASLRLEREEREEQLRLENKFANSDYIMCILYGGERRERGAVAKTSSQTRII